MSLEGIIGIIIGLAGLIYAITENRKRAKLRRNIETVESAMARIAGNIKNIMRRPNLADRHFRKIGEYASDLEQTETTKKITKHTMLGARDAKAAAVALENLLNDFFGVQETLYGQKSIVHLEEQE